MITKLFKLFYGLSFLILLGACSSENNKNTYTIHGDVSALPTKDIKYSFMSTDGKTKSVEVKDGKFTIKGQLDEPTKMGFLSGDNGMYFVLYAENADIHVNFKMVEGYKGMQMLDADVTGSTVHNHYTSYNATEKKFWDDLTKYRQLQENKDEFEKLNAERQKEINHFVKHFRAGKDQIAYDFIKAHPKAFYSAELSYGLAQGRSSEGVKELIAALDPSLKENSFVKKMNEMVSGLAEKEVKLEDIFQVSDIAYQVDKKFDGKELKGIKYLANFTDNTICALTEKGEIWVIDSRGNKLKCLSPEFGKKVSVIAVDKKDVIHAMLPVVEKVKQTFRGKSFERAMITGVECVKLSRKGKELARVKLEGLKGASGVRVVDNKILVADYSSGVIGIFDCKTGKRLNEITDMRQCCGIMDFSVNNKGEVLTANLGAFRVENISLDGKRNFAFGQRGREEQDFHGCCNPVSVAGLSNGAIVTVEKDPTRIKIYSKTGTKIIQGISELVKGCTYIPMIVDNKDNLYLASPEKGMLKCITM